MPCTRNVDPLALRGGVADDLGLGGLEDPDELAADDLALLLRVGDAGERVEEPLRGVDDVQRDPGRGDEVALDLLGLALAQQPVVDEHAGELVADGALHERRRDRGVDAAGQPADRAPVADLGADLLDLLLDDVDHRPGRPAAGDVEQEVAEHLLAVLGVQHLGVPLHAGEPPVEVLEGGDGGAGGGGEHVEPGRRRDDRVAVAHPDPVLAGHVGQQRAGLGDLDGGAAVLRAAGPSYLAAEARAPSPGSRSTCRTPARPAVEDGGVDAGGAGLVDRRRAAGQDDRAAGLRASISATGMVCGTISE